MPALFNDEEVVVGVSEIDKSGGSDVLTGILPDCVLDMTTGSFEIIWGYVR
jgi:hypothetical protein